MQIHQLQPIHKAKEHKRVGRGGKRGTYCGHGQKGQSSRGGRKFQPAIREFIKRYPKLRGYRFGTGREENIVILQLDILNKNFDQKEIINPEKLFEKGLITRVDNRIPQVKILGKTEINKVLVIENCLVSKGAKDLIEKAGGQVIISDNQKKKDVKAQAKEKEFVKKSEKKVQAQAKSQAKEKASAAKDTKAKDAKKSEKAQRVEKAIVRKTTGSKPKSKK
ncbi:MAG: uL15 family ribosomal protein [Candidatus Paceibacterota bacterium]|jgi:large subunit ribosomal protein L15